MVTGGCCQGGGLHSGGGRHCCDDHGRGGGGGHGGGSGGGGQVTQRGKGLAGKQRTLSLYNVPVIVKAEVVRATYK